MTAYNVSDNPQSQHIASVHAAAISVAFVSGTLALIALLLGSPLEFGSALAVCGMAWIVANFAERLAEEKHTHYRRTLTSTRPTSSAVMPGYVCLRALARPDRCSATTPRASFVSST